MGEKRVLFVTVGTTALTAEDLGKEWENSRVRVLRQTAQGYAKGTLKLAATEAEDLLDRALEAHRATWGRVFGPKSSGIAGHMDETSAEMTSTYLLTHTIEEQPQLRAGHDQIVLLASDTAAGQLSARLNARLMHEFLFASPGCTCKAQPRDPAPCESVQIARVRGLEAKRFTATVSGELFGILDGYKAWGKRLFNITGGYKGTVPAITSWAKRYGGELYYQYMTSTDTVRIEFVPGDDSFREELAPLPPTGDVGA